MKVVLCNDDIGLTYGFTDAIKDTFLKGNCSSTSIRTNGLAYDYTVKLLKKDLKKIGLGLHLNIVDGKAHTAELANNLGDYKYNFLEYILLSHNKTVLKNIENEFDWQFQKVLRDGLKIDHISGHCHTYAIPELFEIACRLCQKYQIKSIRLIHEPFYLTNSLSKNISPLFNSNLIKFGILNRFSRQNRDTMKKYRLKTVDAFYGVLYTDAMNFQTVKAALLDAKKRNYKIIELLIHPAYPNDSRDKKYTSQTIKNYVKQKSRRIETKTIQSDLIKKLILEVGIELAELAVQ